MKRRYFNLLGTFLGFAALLCGALPVLAQTAPTLGADLATFGALGNSGVVGSTNVGTIVNGNVGSAPNTPSVTNFPPSSAPGYTVYTVADTVTTNAHNQAITAYNDLATQGLGIVLDSSQLANRVLTPGIYSFPGGNAGFADLEANGLLILNGGPTDVFIFQVGTTLTANVGSDILGTANPCNVYWRVGTSATLNGDTFRGNVFADASITVGDGADVFGRVIAGSGTTGAVTMAGDGGNAVAGLCVAGGACTPLTVNPSTLPSTTVGVAYDETVSASGGSGTYTFEVTSGTLPPGLVLDDVTGQITGTATTDGSFPITITATDTLTGCLGSRDYDIFVSPAGVPALDFVGLAILMALMAGVGLFVVRRSI